MRTVEELIGKTIKLGEYDTLDKKTYKVSKIKESASSIAIFTDLRTFNILKSNIPVFLDQIETVENNTTIYKPKTNLNKANLNKVDLTIFEPTEMQKNAENALNSVLEKVLAKEEGSKEQAESVCNVVQTMINMEKSQTQLIKLANKLS